jgi:GDP-L-fucose synthase
MMQKNNSNYFKNKHVLVTGAAGFIGTHLVHRLVDLGAKVRGTLHNKSPQYQEPSVEFINCDLTRAEDCAKACHGIDFVFMAAANSSGAAVIQKTPLVHLTPNIIMNANMLEAAYECEVKKFCFISSNTVYPLTDFAVSEDDANFEFYDKYFVVGWMKRFSELMCEMYSTKISNPMKTLVVRPGNLYGPFDKFTLKESKVIAALIRRAIEREDPFVVWGDGLDIKDFLYIEDFIDGLVLAFEQTNDFQPVNIASGRPVTIREVLNIILDVADYKNNSIKYDSSKPTMIPKRMIDIGRISQITKWSPNTNLKDGIQKTVDWYRETYYSRTPEDFTK